MTGALKPIAGSPFSIPPPSECNANSYGAAISPTGQFLYVADNGCSAVTVFSINSMTGVPTQTASSPFFFGAGDCFTGPNDDSLDAMGRFFYVANNGCGNISAFSADAATGDLTEVVGSPFAAGNGPYGVAVSRIN